MDGNNLPSLSILRDIAETKKSIQDYENEQRMYEALRKEPKKRAAARLYGGMIIAASAVIAAVGYLVNACSGSERIVYNVLLSPAYLSGAILLPDGISNLITGQNHKLLSKGLIFLERQRLRGLERELRRNAADNDC